MGRKKKQPLTNEEKEAFGKEKRKKEIDKMLREYGVTNEKQLDNALKNMQPMDISVFAKKIDGIKTTSDEQNSSEENTKK